MITELNKKEIYNLLKSKLSFNQPYPLAEVGKELTSSGHGCRRYGFARMKNLMKEIVTTWNSLIRFVKKLYQEQKMS